MSSIFYNGWNAQQTDNINDAIKYYELAREQGDECAVFHLNCMERYGQGIPIVINHKLTLSKVQLKEETFDTLYQLYSQDTTENIFNRGLLYELQKEISKAKACFERIEYPPAWTKLSSLLRKDGRHLEAIKLYERASEAGYHFAQYSLGSYDLINNEKDRGIVLLEKAMAQNYKRAYMALGLFYLEHKDYQKSLSLFTKASELGSKQATYILGKFYFEGHGIEQDYVKAFDYMLKSAHAGYVPAYTIIGLHYKYGDGVEQNYEKAVSWFQKADEAGNIYHGLGELYLKGLGVSQDYNKAMYYYMKRAEKDDVFGLYGVGYLYLEGLGVTQNFSLAISYFERASKQIHVMSIDKLKYIKSLPNKIDKIVKDLRHNNFIDFNQFKQQLLQIKIKNCYDPLVIQWILEALNPYNMDPCDIINGLHDN